MRSFWTFITTTAALFFIHLWFPFDVLWCAYKDPGYKADRSRIWNDYLDANRLKGEDNGTNNPY